MVSTETPASLATAAIVVAPKPSARNRRSAASSTAFWLRCARSRRLLESYCLLTPITIPFHTNFVTSHCSENSGLEGGQHGTKSSRGGRASGARDQRARPRGDRRVFRRGLRERDTHTSAARISGT